MSTSPAPASAFHWNAGGWFGSLLGGTLWLLVAAVAFAPIDLVVAGGTLGLFLAAVGVGLLLWRRRRRLAAYPAIQVLLATLLVCATGAFLLWDHVGAQPVLDALDRASSVPFHYGWLLVFPGMMALFAWRERAARRAGLNDAGGPPDSRG